MPHLNPYSSLFFIEMALRLHALKLSFITHLSVNTSNAHHSGDAALVVLWETHGAAGLGNKKDPGVKEQRG